MFRSTAMSATGSRMPARSRAVMVLDGMLGLVWVWRERARQRRVLGGLDERMLGDIGLSHGTAWRESVKPFWQA